MGIIPGFLGLTLAFLLIVVVLLWFFITANVNLLYKVIIIPVVIWYSLVLWFTPSKWMGWPTIDAWPDGAIIEHIKIHEPRPNKEGYFYFVLIDDNYMERMKALEEGRKYEEKKPTFWDNLDPRNVFSFKGDNVERSYIMPYDREFHKMLTQKSKEKKEMGARAGAMRLFRKMNKGDQKLKNKGQGKKMPHEMYDIKIGDKSLNLKKAPIPGLNSN